MSMRAVLFTKMFRGQTLELIGSTTQDLGFDGVDLLIRPGHQLDPHEPDAIPPAVRLLERQGTRVPMATTDLTDPDALPSERLLAQCREAGIELIRLGYWSYDPERGYAAGRDRARRHLDILERLARNAGICLAIQLHGDTIHSSGALTVALLEGRDPTSIGAYPDPGNQAVQSGREDWRLTFDVLRPWLRCVGVKNGGWCPAEIAPSGQRRWRSDWLGLADGMVPWDEITGYLRASGYDGFLSFHSHYEVPLEQSLDQTRTDLRFIRRQMALRQMPGPA
jgi:sugar phosphate isomerase/epimerase